MDKYDVILYEERGKKYIDDFIYSLPPRDQSKIVRTLDTLKLYGLQSIIPHVRKLVGYPLWELRFLGGSNIRLFYVVKVNRRVIILHGFVKKSNKTSSREISIALHRFKKIVDI